MSNRKGFFKVFREDFDSELSPASEGRPFTRMEAWLDLQSLATWRPSTWNDIELKAGQFIRSKSSLAERWCWSRGQVIRFIDAMIRKGRITQQHRGQIILFTITRYAETTCDAEEQPDHPTDHPSPPLTHYPSTTSEIKKPLPDHPTDHIRRTKEQRSTRAVADPATGPLVPGDPKISDRPAFVKPLIITKKAIAKAVGDTRDKQKIISNLTTLNTLPEALYADIVSRAFEDGCGLGWIVNAVWNEFEERDRRKDPVHKPPVTEPTHKPTPEPGRDPRHVGSILEGIQRLIEERSELLA